MPQVLAAPGYGSHKKPRDYEILSRSFSKRRELQKCRDQNPSLSVLIEDLEAIAPTDHPLGLKKLVPLRVHGQVEVPYVPALLLLPIVTGALRDRTARFYFGFLFATSLANFPLPNYNVYEPQKPAPNP